MAITNPRTAARMGKWFADSVSASPAAATATPPSGPGLLSDGAQNTVATPTTTPKPAKGARTGILSDATGATPPPGPSTAAPEPAPPTKPPVAPPTTPATTPIVPPIPASTVNKGSTGPKGVNKPYAELTDEDLTLRTENPNATVEDRLTGLLDEDGKYIQTARAQGQRAAASRGLLNSSIAAGAGEDAAVRAALPIAQQDAGYFASIDEYNTALKNQAAMFNKQSANEWNLADLQSATQKQIALTQATAQITAAQIAAATSRYNTELQTNASRYATDRNAQTQADNLAFQRWQTETNNAAALDRQNHGNHDALVNNILLNTDIPPEVRARLLRELGANDLADAVFLDVSHDLGGGNSHGGDNTTGD